MSFVPGAVLSAFPLDHLICPHRTWAGLCYYDGPRFIKQGQWLLQLLELTEATWWLLNQEAP